MFDQDALLCPAVPDEDELVIPAETYNAPRAFGTLAIGLEPTTAVTSASCGNQPSFVTVTLRHTTFPLPDLNGNGVPDECELCSNNAPCNDGDVCTFDLCDVGLCANTGVGYADVAGPGGTYGPDGGVDLFDILAVLDGFEGRFANGCELSNIDIGGSQGSCDPNDLIDLSDVLNVLEAFQRLDRCCK